MLNKRRKPRGNSSLIDLDAVTRLSKNQNQDPQLPASNQCLNQNIPVSELCEVDDVTRHKKRLRSKSLHTALNLQPLKIQKTKSVSVDLIPIEIKSSSRNDTDAKEPAISKDDEIDLFSTSESTTKSKNTNENLAERGSSLNCGLTNLATSSFKGHTVSPHFNPNKNIKVLGNKSNSETIHIPTRRTNLSSRDDDEISTDKSVERRLLTRPCHDESFDEISATHYREANKFRKASRNTMEGMENPPRDAADPWASRKLDKQFHKKLISDEECNTRKVAPSPTLLKKSIKNSMRESRFQVIQVFCGSKVWLVSTKDEDMESKEMWTVSLNHEEKSLAIYNGMSKFLPDLELGRVNKIQWSLAHGKILISKPASPQIANGAHRICLEFKTSDECKKFLRRLRRVDPNVIFIHRDGVRHLEKIFEHTRKVADLAVSKSTQKEPPTTLHIDETDNLKSLETYRKKSEDYSSHNSDIIPSPSDRSRSIVKSMTTRCQFDEARSKIKLDSEISQKFSSHSENESPIQRSALYSREPRSSANKRIITNIDDIRSSTPEPEKWTKANPKWVDQWYSSVVYPKEGKNKATVDQADIERLDEGEFINDNLMMFYLRWLQHRTEQEYPEVAKRVYFYNTFFYERLTKNSKGKTGINYDNVERWTSKINLLEYDYIVVPVNENFHWYVAIICNAPKLLDAPQISDARLEFGKNANNTYDQKFSSSSIIPSSPIQLSTHIPALETNLKTNNVSLAAQTSDNDDETDPILLESPQTRYISTSDSYKKTNEKLENSIEQHRSFNPSKPRIITLDSFGQAHSLTCTNLKKYLLKEIESKFNRKIQDPGNLGRTAKKIPQQDNYFDCGLFVLGYIEIFLRSPDEFISSLLQNKFPENMEWPKPSDMRAKIRCLLLDLQKDYTEEETTPNKKGSSIKYVKEIHGDDNQNKALLKENSKNLEASISTEIDEKRSRKLRDSTDQKQSSLALEMSSKFRYCPGERHLRNHLGSRDSKFFEISLQDIPTMETKPLQGISQPASVLMKDQDISLQGRISPPVLYISASPEAEENLAKLSANNLTHSTLEKSSPSPYLNAIDKNQASIPRRERIATRLAISRPAPRCETDNRDIYIQNVKELNDSHLLCASASLDTNDSFQSFQCLSTGDKAPEAGRLFLSSLISKRFSNRQNYHPPSAIPINNDSGSHDNDIKGPTLRSRTCSESWQRDGLEKAMIKKSSKPAVAHDNRHACRQKKDSSVILIE
ncbi:Peptidase [Blumeria graminis f. sp. tritici 96224]|uniref:Peptidase n=1 Tax=Blumeria graminis f. sp. tritici 96224 TaxID=1268274 RepID=A0A656KQM1_BLUGR|nr:Peptidase [Blumeria graminis f. sp. tritici 96224]